ncbi:MAG: LacI family DNA-binding transcriptional regulator [Mycobacterium sp.]
MATIVEVARRAGVSVSTVSHVVNRTRFVSPSTARVVNEAIAHVGYLPNSVARALKRASTSSVGLAISAISNPYFSDIICAVEAECARLGLMVFLSDTQDAPAEPAKAAPPVKGLGIAAGARRPGKKPAAAAAPAEATAETTTETTPEPAKPEPPVKGLGIAAGARRPGKKPAASATPAPAAAPATSAPAAAPEATPEPEAAEPAKPEPPVKGLGIAPGARRPGAKKPAPKPAEPQQETPAPPKAEPSNGDSADESATEPKASAEPTKPEPPVKGLGIAPGVRRPGKR